MFELQGTSLLVLKFVVWVALLGCHNHVNCKFHYLFFLSFYVIINDFEARGSVSLLTCMPTAIYVLVFITAFYIQKMTALVRN